MSEQQKIYAMMRKEYADPKVVQMLSDMLNVTPAEEPCADCGEMCIRTEQPVSVAGVIRDGDNAHAVITERDEERIKVCTNCAADRAFAVGDFEAGARYQFAVTLFEEAAAKGFGE